MKRFTCTSVILLKITERLDFFFWFVVDRLLAAESVRISVLLAGAYNYGSQLILTS